MDIVLQNNYVSFQLLKALSQDYLFTNYKQEDKVCFQFSIQQHEKKVFISIIKWYKVLKHEFIYIHYSVILLEQVVINPRKIFMNAPQKVIYLQTEVVVQRCSVKKLFLDILQNSQENTCTRVFLIKNTKAHFGPYQTSAIPKRC